MGTGAGLSADFLSRSAQEGGSFFFGAASAASPAGDASSSVALLPCASLLSVVATAGLAARDGKLSLLMSTMTSSFTGACGGAAVGLSVAGVSSASSCSCSCSCSSSSSSTSTAVGASASAGSSASWPSSASASTSSAVPSPSPPSASCSVSPSPPSAEAAFAGGPQLTALGVATLGTGTAGRFGTRLGKVRAVSLLGLDAFIERRAMSAQDFLPGSFLSSSSASAGSSSSRAFSAPCSPSSASAPPSLSLHSPAAGAPPAPLQSPWPDLC
mmetsp:Transcript_133140/g.284609  ORF Transcript_133140/g.284609 Transcript_133140/m.284609 type:complete len:271 (-) Transcript_133140:652-1464(-)